MSEFMDQQITNGLLSLDGSQFSIWFDNEPFTFNVALAVDVASFTHTAFSVADTETTQEVIRVLEAHRRQWGTPLGVVCDQYSANLSKDATDYIQAQGIELVAAGPANPKGNGTDEGAFSQMKKALGEDRGVASSFFTSVKNEDATPWSSSTPWSSLNLPMTSRGKTRTTSSSDWVSLPFVPGGSLCRPATRCC